MQRKRRLASAAAATTVAALTAMPNVCSAEWRFTPTLSVRETYTDNVRLTRPGTETSDFVTDLAPGIMATHEGRRFKFQANYALHALAYVNEGEANTILHQLNATANAELIDDFFFIDGRAAVDQQNISLLGPQPVDNTSITENRSTVKTVSVSPYLINRFGRTASSELRYTHSTVTSSTGGLLSARTDGVLLALRSGPAFRSLGWGLAYSKQKIDREDAQSVDASTVAGNLRYMVTPQFYLTATAGYDKYNYLSLGDEPEGRFYTGGFTWNPTERTSFSASAGRRLWGRTYSLDATTRSRHVAWQVAYNEEITTTQSEFAVQATASTAGFLNQLFLSSIPDPEQRRQVVDRFILSAGLPSSLTRTVNYFTNQFFLQKGLQASVAITGARNTLMFSVVNARREAQTATSGIDPLSPLGSLSLNGDTRQTGVSAIWNWKVTPLTDATFSADHTTLTQLSTDTRERLNGLRAALARRINPKVDGVLELRRQRKTSDVAQNEYVEHAISAFLSMRF